MVSCTQKRLEITSEYIINENWSKKGEQISSNSIDIDRMKIVTDSIINPFSDLLQAELLSKLIVDSSFMYYANIKINDKEVYANKKIFFNLDNGFFWRDGKNNYEASSTKTIGNLQKGNWYRFSSLGLLSTQFIYVYVDSTNKTHRFNVMHSNF